MLSDRYRLTQRLAAGGMGEVWRGEDVMLHRPVAIKVMLPALRTDREFVTRFRTEARMMAALRHPGIVQVYDYGETPDGDYLVMEFVEGIPLSRRIEQAGRLSPAETMTVVAQVADALQVAHEAGIVHRDVKPANLLVRPGGAIVLVDFGVARSETANGLTGTNVVLGSANYMAPEQAEGKPIGPPTDVYALGAVAYCCLTGRPPYVGENPLQVLTQLVYGELPALPPDVPPPVAALVLRALAKEPAQRFASAAELASAARSPGRGSSGAPPQQTRPYRPNGGPGQTAAGFPSSGRAQAGPRPGQTSGRMPIPGAAAAGGYPGSAPGGGYPGGAPGGGYPGGAPAGGYPPTQVGGYPSGAQGRFQPGAQGGRPSGAQATPGAQGGAPGAHGGYPSGAQAGGFQPGRAQAGRAPQTGFNSSASASVSGAAAVPRPGAASGSGGGTGGGGFGAGTPDPGPAKRSRTMVVAAVAAVLVGVGGVGTAVAWPSLTGGGSDGAGASPYDALNGGDTTTEPTAKPGGTDKTKTPKPGRTTKTEPAPEPTTAKPEAEPQDPVAACGDGFDVVDQKNLRGGGTSGRVYLLHNDDSDEDCVVTVKLTGIGENSPMSAYLEVEGQGPTQDNTSSIDYVGPVRAQAAEACIKWGGSINDKSFFSDFDHCD
ncbi:serine/threonine protein kinase [Paractinoplanes brasiliensis]|uniref:non-specific serine/threonine protein kinase n=2 Tax=Paractinoplanes brasiliensis TaxID=52695 RepID=A0A4R6JCL9_9ACTN|nr:serine/threonine protein kinase [Actinoplanes brasiliensis]